LATSQLYQLQIPKRGNATGQRLGIYTASPKIKMCYNEIHVPPPRLVVSIEGKEEEFPWVWLRDNCQCPQCYEALSRCRIHNLTEWDIGVKPRQVEVDHEAVKVEWEGGHQSSYPLEWLKERSFREEARTLYREKVSTPQELWGSELANKIPTVDFTQVMEDDAALLDWLETLDRLGFVLVRGVPVERGPVPKLQARVAFERLTHYGPGYTVEVRPDPSNISHTAHRIFFHTDLTYYDHMPGTIFLHCIEQHEGEGGETMLVDAFHAAQILRKKHPKMYQLLSNTVASFRDVGTDYIKFDSISQQPFFVHNGRGELVRLNWSHFARDSHLDAPIDQVEELYMAMRTFDDLMNAEENHIRLKMKPGDMVTVKNTRIMHGRSELKGGISGRSLQCGYMDWDEIRSRIRVTRAKLANEGECYQRI